MTELSDSDFMSMGTPQAKQPSVMNDADFMNMGTTKPTTQNSGPVQVPYDKNDDLTTSLMKHLANTVSPYMTDQKQNLSTGQQAEDVAKGTLSGLAQGAAGAFTVPFDIGSHAIPYMQNAAEYLGTKAANAITGKETEPDYVSAPPSITTPIMEALSPDLKTAMGNRAQLAGNIIGPESASSALEKLSALAENQTLRGGLEELAAGELPPAPVPKLSPEQAKATGILQQALDAEGIKPEDIADKLEQAKATGLPLTALDVATEDQNGVLTRGRNLIGLTKSAATFPGEAPKLSGDVVARAAGMRDRIASAFDNLLSGSDYYQTEGQLAQQMKASGAAYDKAFEGGSTAPLQTQFENAFAEHARQEGLADDAMKNAQTKMTLAQAKASQAGDNVYANSSANDAIKSAQSDINAAQQLKDQTSAQKQNTLSALQQAQSDAANGIRGGVWSPKIQQFISQPEVKAGIKNGLQLERLDAITEGRPFDPREYSITGYDENGDPIVSSVPNMRLLDAGKRGLDAMIEGERKIDGSFTQLGRSLTRFKNSYLSQLDELNPDYAVARKAFGDPASQRQALQNGRQFTTMDPEEISQYMSDPKVPDANKAAFAIGARRNIADTMAKNSSDVRALNNIWKDSYKDRLKALSPDAQTFQSFSDAMDAEQKMAKINQVHLGGSDTMLKKNFGDEIQNAPAGKLSSIVHAVTSPKTAILQAGAGFLDRNLQKSAASMSNGTAAEIMRHLTTNDPAVWRNFGKVPNAANAPAMPPLNPLVNSGATEDDLLNKLSSIAGTAVSSKKNTVGGPYKRGGGIASGKQKALLPVSGGTAREKDAGLRDASGTKRLPTYSHKTWAKLVREHGKSAKVKMSQLHDGEARERLLNEAAKKGINKTPKNAGNP